VSKTIEERRQALRRRKHRRRAGINDLFITLAIVSVVVALAAVAITFSLGPKPEPTSPVAAAAGPKPHDRGAPTAKGPRDLPEEDARAWAQTSAPDGRQQVGRQQVGRQQVGRQQVGTNPVGTSAAGSPPVGTHQLGQLPDDVAASLEAAGNNVLPAQAGASTTLDLNAAAQLQNKLKQAQEQLDALGGSRTGPLPEEDPAALEQLPPDIRELYRRQLGR